MDMDEKDEAARLSIDELAERTGIPTRTIRYYITTRLISGPTSRGKQASYGADHLLRLRLIRRLTARYMPLEEIARRLQGLTTGDVEALLAQEDEHAAAQEDTTRPVSPRAYIESLLRRPHPSPPPAAPVSQVVGYHMPSVPPAASPAQAPMQPAPARSPEQAIRYQPVSAPLPAGAQARSAKMADAAPAVRSKETAWKRWELAPGLELQVEAGLEADYKSLIEALLRVAAGNE
jgi:DNA-binding transcriptional MerR regulator